MAGVQDWLVKKEKASWKPQVNQLKTSSEEMMFSVLTRIAGWYGRFHCKTSGTDVVWCLGCWEVANHNLHHAHRSLKNASHFYAALKTLMTFHYTGWLIGILILLYYDPYITGLYNPLYKTTNRGEMNTAHSVKWRLIGKFAFHERINDAIFVLGKSGFQRPTWKTRVSHAGFLDFLLIWVLNQKIGVVPPKSSILIGLSIINNPFWGTPIFGNIHMLMTRFLPLLSFWVVISASFFQTFLCSFELFKNWEAQWNRWLRFTLRANGILLMASGDFQASNFRSRDIWRKKHTHTHPN